MTFDEKEFNFWINLEKKLYNEFENEIKKSEEIILKEQMKIEKLNKDCSELFNKLLLCPFYWKIKKETEKAYLIILIWENLNFNFEMWIPKFYFKEKMEFNKKYDSSLLMIL